MPSLEELRLQKLRSLLIVLMKLCPELLYENFSKKIKFMDISYISSLPFNEAVVFLKQLIHPHISKKLINDNSTETNRKTVQAIILLRIIYNNITISEEWVKEIDELAIRTLLEDADAGADADVDADIDIHI